MSEAVENYTKEYEIKGKIAIVQNVMEKILPMPSGILLQLAILSRGNTTDAEDNFRS